MKGLLTKSLFFSMLFFAMCAYAAGDGKIIVKAGNFFRPNQPENASTRQLIQFMEKNPDILIERWSGISLPGSARTGLMMAIAGKTAPDFGLNYFAMMQSYIRQGYLYPLNEWIGDDVNGDGVIDDSEAKWPGWKNFSPITRRVATLNGKVYGLPLAVKILHGIVFRADLAEAAGLDVSKTPRTWNELLYWCRKLTYSGVDSEKAGIPIGQRGILLHPYAWSFLSWIRAAGGEPIVQYKISPKTGKRYEFGQDETVFLTPDGENLIREPSIWNCNLDTEEGIQALRFFHKMRWGKWVVIDGVPMDLEDAREKGLEFDESQIVTGVASYGASERGGGTEADQFARGEFAMLVASIEDLTKLGSSGGIDPSLLSWFPFPAADTPKGKRVIQTFNNYAVMYPGVGDRPKAERDAVWRTLQAVCDESTANVEVESRVLQGMGRFVSPKALKRLGYEEYLRDIPLAVRKNFEEIAEGKVLSFPEPWIGQWHPVSLAMTNECLGILLGSQGEHFDYIAAMRSVNEKANNGLMFDTPDEVLQKYRPWAWGTMILAVVGMSLLIVMIVRSMTRKRKDGARSVYKGWLPFLLILPAVGIILLWRYYPLCRGLIMAFQDYKVTGDSVMVGMDNFINLVIDKGFWMSLWRTVYFVFLNMLFAFTAPIILAILLTEIRRFKIFYRTLFFLPQMTSGLVIALMWAHMYNPTPAGFFNQMITYFNYLPFVDLQPQAWLQDPKLAMLCCILPTVWASMGMASLLYLAALHSISSDLYEAADLDGAGVRAKLRYITLPTLMPLIIISFVGTFIATFQNMGNIFLMTFGGPGEATTVIGLKIWQEAYVNMRFGMATAMACLLGTLLIGLTYIQIKILSKVEYKRAKD